MKRHIEGWNRRQSFLLLECMDDYLDENNPARAIEAFVDKLDLAELSFGRAVPSETGRPGYHPAVLLKLYLYGYLTALATQPGVPEQLMIDSTHLKAHRIAASLLEEGAVPRRIGRTRGGLNSKLHAVCDGHGCPIAMLLSEGQMSDHKGAALLLPILPPGPAPHRRPRLRQPPIPGCAGRARN